MAQHTVSIFFRGDLGQAGTAIGQYLCSAKTEIYLLLWILEVDLFSTGNKRDSVGFHRWFASRQQFRAPPPPPPSTADGSSLSSSGGAFKYLSILFVLKEFIACPRQSRISPCCWSALLLTIVESSFLLLLLLHLGRCLLSCRTFYLWLWPSTIAKETKPWGGRRKPCYRNLTMALLTLFMFVIVVKKDRYSLSTAEE